MVHCPRVVVKPIYLHLILSARFVHVPAFAALSQSAMSTLTSSIHSQTTKAKEAVDKVDPQKWASTPVSERIKLLEKVRDRLSLHADAIAAGMAQTRNVQETIFSQDSQLMLTCFPFLATLNQLLSFYQVLLQKGNNQMVRPKSIQKVGDGLWDIETPVLSTPEKIVRGSRREYLRVRSDTEPVPRRRSPLDKKPSGIIAVLGPGNFASPIEVIRALYIENCAVVHKSHPLNVETDKVWQHVLQPLVDHGVVSFCQADDGTNLIQDERLCKIYFTGGAPRAEAIAKTTTVPLVSECGGCAPVVVVPGDWTEKEIRHQALLIATVSKANGGAICARPQVIVTCKQWPQREAFVQSLRQALSCDTPAFGNWYPGAQERMQQFKEEYSNNVTVFQPEAGKYQTADVLFIENANVGGYVCTNEAFSQVLAEVALDVEADPKVFLPSAVKFCNDDLMGTLVATILVDKNTQKLYQDTVTQAVTDLKYGSISVNGTPLFAVSNAYLIWGGNERELDHIESGKGNFGNLLGYEDAEKSVLVDDFVSPSHITITNKQHYDELSVATIRYLVAPSLWNLIKMIYCAVRGKMRKKDF